MGICNAIFNWWHSEGMRLLWTLCIQCILKEAEVLVGWAMGEVDSNMA